MRAEERERREDRRFQMQMMMMNLMNQNRQPSSSINPPAFAPIHAPMTQDSVNSSQDVTGEFDGQDFLNMELMKRTTGI